MSAWAIVGVVAGAIALVALIAWALRDPRKGPRESVWPDYDPTGQGGL